MAEARAPAATVRNLVEVYEARETTGRLADLHDLVDPTLHELRAALRYERVFIAVVDTERGGLQGLGGPDVTDELEEILCEPGRERSVFEEALDTGRPLRV